ncbi:hypothetical protein [Paraburkholderia aromaticivorans]|uniref:hypothetical protein n=1 Tax=Paraburkholderia aromaticivorans TaxID=2026199 RepID=UPI0038BB6FF1
MSSQPFIYDDNLNRLNSVIKEKNRNILIILFLAVLVPISLMNYFSFAVIGMDTMVGAFYRAIVAIFDFAYLASLFYAVTRWDEVTEPGFDMKRHFQSR